jgi:2-dehydro-3-deoxy-L-rhamnonate dehydrogenase (NAD+)
MGFARTKRVSTAAARFQGRAAIVTGGGSGAGKAVAARIAAEGGRVCLWDVSADALASAKAATGAELIDELDVSNAARVAEAAARANEKFGRVDILVVCAGITGDTAPLADYPIESWKRVIDINLNGPFYCCRAVIPYMRANGYGRIVNVSSVAGKEGNPNASAYSASKAGLIGLTKSLGKELAQTGILANAVTPATFKSPILDQLPQSQIDYMLSRIPMGRLGEAQEVAALICWLASEECSFSTGAVFDLSGGRSTY